MTRRFHCRTCTVDFDAPDVPATWPDESAIRVTVHARLGHDVRVNVPRQRAALAVHHAFLEALCGTCGETFNPADEDDTIHIERADGTPCGGAATGG